jgi:hypothetical protein
MMDQKMLDAFHMMWGPFPEPVLLVHKNRTILAVNDLARSAGIPVETKCFSLNPEARGAACKHCKANLALRERRTICTEETRDGKRIIGYWMPLKDEDIYVHFGVGTAEAISCQPCPPEKTPELVTL